MAHDRFSYRGGTAPSDFEPDLQLVTTHLSTKEDGTVRWDSNLHTQTYHLFLRMIHNLWIAYRIGCVHRLAKDV